MKKFALLVGVEDYRDKMISRLNFARADANALADRLRNRCGFDQVRVLADENGDDEPLLVNIVTALRDTAVELAPEDLFLFFFAGHGLEKDGHGYLLARDSLQAFPEHGSLSLELLRKTLAHFSAGKRILLLDACRNSPEAGRGDAANCMGDVISRDIVAAARSKLTGGTTTALLSACRSGQRAYEWPAKGHGVFTQYLVEGIDGAAWQGEQLEFDRLAGYAATRVCEWTANTPGLSLPQEPWYEKFGAPDPIRLAGANSSTIEAPPVLQPPAPVTPPKDTNSKPVATWWVEPDLQRTTNNPFLLMFNLLRRWAPPWLKRWPTAPGTKLGQMSISVGAVIGFCVGIWITSRIMSSLMPRGPGGESPQRNGHLLLFEYFPVCGLLAYVGGCVGLLAYRALRRRPARAGELRGARAFVDETIPLDVALLMAAGGLAGWALPWAFVEAIRDRGAGMSDLWGLWWYWSTADKTALPLLVWLGNGREAAGSWALSGQGTLVRLAVIPMQWALTVIGSWLGHLVSLGLTAHRNTFGAVKITK